MQKIIKMAIKLGKYKNIVELYNSSSEFKKLFDDDKGNSHAEDKVRNYFGNHGERSGIIDGVLSDTIGGQYKWKLSKHKYWEDVQIEILKK